MSVPDPVESGFYAQTLYIYIYILPLTPTLIIQIVESLFFPNGVEAFTLFAIAFGFEQLLSNRGCKSNELA